MTTQIVTLDAPEIGGVEKSKADQIKGYFLPMAKMLKDFENLYGEVVAESKEGITKELTAKAKRLRLDIGKVRIETEKVRKSQKEEYLRAGKAIDGVANILKWAVADKESKLKEIEQHFEIQEQKRLEEVQRVRVELLSPYVEDAHERHLSDMDDDVFQAYLSTKKKDHEDRVAAEKKAEEERIAIEKAEAEERERIRIENIRLQKEAEEREKQMQLEREKAEIERKKIEEEARKKQEALEVAARKECEEREAAEKIERQKREELQRKIREREEADRIAAEEEFKQEQSRLNADDKSKVEYLISDLKELKQKYSFKSDKNKKVFADACRMIDDAIKIMSK